MPDPDTLRLPDRYRVLEHIANGGMASVWAAEDVLLHRRVAVKVLSAALAQDPGARRRFTREARAAARVSGHPHVVAIYDIGEHDGQAFIVMEHLAGGTVASRLKGQDAVPVPTALRWLGEAAAALDAAHDADIVHRDVKPGNLLLDERDRLAVGDFGIASLAGETALTQAGQVVGTAAYLSPEQARGQSATAASDRYSLAVVAYELLCGRRPWGGDTPMEQLSARLHADLPAPTGAAAAAAEALAHGLAREPQDRPATAAAFVAGLRDGLGDADDPPTSATRAMPAAGAAAALGAGAAVAAGGAGGAYAAVRREPRTPRPAPARAGAGGGAAGPPPPPDRQSPDAAGGLSRAFVLAVVAAVLLGAGVAFAALGGGDEEPAARAETTATAEQPPAEQPPAAEQPVEEPPPEPAPEPEPEAPAPPVQDGRSPAELNDAGFDLLPDRAGEALPLLQSAVQGYRDAGDTTSQGYSFAIYNLGMALRRTGNPGEAIPFFEERLNNFDDRDDEVEAELDLALEESGQAPRGNGNGSGGDSDSDDDDDDD